MDANTAEIMIKSLLHERARRNIERLARRSQDLVNNRRYVRVVASSTFRSLTFALHFLFAALVAFTALLGLGIYRGSRICILVVTIMVLYNWSQLFQYFSWPEWILAILFVLAVSAGFIGAVIYHRVRAREAA